MKYAFSELTSKISVLKGYRPFQMVFSFSVSVEKNDPDVTSCAKQIEAISEYDFWVKMKAWGQIIPFLK